MAVNETDFGVRLRRLIATVHPPDCGPYSIREIARGVTDAGVKMSATTVHQLSTGQRTEPKMRDVQGLAAFFGVPVDYFLDPQVAARVDEQIDQVRINQSKDAMNLALRTLELSPEGKIAVNNLISALEEHQRGSNSSRRRRSDE